MATVLIHDDSPDSGNIHETNRAFINSNKTVCGKKLHPISTTHTPMLNVTCCDCLKEETVVPCPS